MKINPIIQVILITVIFLFVQCKETKKSDENLELDNISRMILAGDSLNALEKLQKGFLINFPENNIGWTILGNLYEDRGQDTRAEMAYERAIMINKNNEKAYTGLGIIQRKQGEYDKALEYYQKSVDINPNYGPAYSSMGAIELKRKNFVKARKLLEKAHKLDPEDAIIASNLSIIYHYIGAIDKRDLMYEIAKELGHPHLKNLDLIFEGKLSIFN